MSDHPRRRRIRKFADGSIYVLGVGLALLLLYYAESFYGSRVRHTNLVLGLCLAIFYIGLFRDALDPDATEAATYLNYLPQTVQNAYSRFVRPILFVSLAIVSLGVVAYVDVHHVRWMEEGPIVGYRTIDYVVGAVIIYLCTDVTVRSFGKLMASIVPIGFLYGYLGPYMPGALYHSGMDTMQLLRLTVLGMQGVYGFILQIGATWVAIFLLLAGFTKAYGILDYLMIVSKEVSKLFKSGIVHAAVLASLAFGSITGASAANTATTGSFTIPLMKDQGVDKGYAGGIETVASIGGQLVPPIMGIAAFIMADLLGLPYVRIIQAGLIPAILFYFSIIVSVQLLIYKFGWSTERNVSDVDYGVFLEILWYVAPFAVLIYLLGVLQYTPLTAGFYTTLALVGFVFVKYVYEEKSAGAKSAVRDTVEGMKLGSEDMAPLLVILGVIGVIIGVFTQTGFAQRLNTLMISLAGGSILLLLLLAMAVSLIFGLGMPAPAAYVLVASLAGAAMVRFGVQELVAHMFVFYFAMYSSLTPPVGPSTIVAAKIAEAEYLDTAVKSSKLALPGFVIPFIFVANDVIIYWEFPATVMVTFGVLMGVVALCITIFGYDGSSRLSVVGRSIYVVLAVLSFFGPYFGFFDHSVQALIGVAILVLVVSTAFKTIPGVSRLYSQYLTKSPRAAEANN
ncbi:TRAP transporter permease [Halobellus captivus]|uniref:TRAP transporter permease n=1 Tax=Halobellus captivus TaxID=2592614 RepID=UPI00119ED9E8|nr:TRAP transporter fused permease subunit [Halobellus captivus]